MRLIDANALKFKNLAEVNGRLTYVLTSEEIDNAPTVCKDDCSLCSKAWICDKKNERPQGEWIEVEPTEEDKEYGFDTRIVCSRCYEPDSHYDYDECHKPKAVWYFRPNFCPNCGADMRGANGKVDS